MEALWAIFADMTSPPSNGTYLRIEKLSSAEAMEKFCIVPSVIIVFLSVSVLLNLSKVMLLPRKSAAVKSLLPLNEDEYSSIFVFMKFAPFKLVFLKLPFPKLMPDKSQSLMSISLKLILALVLFL